MQQVEHRKPYDGRSDRARAVITAECRTIADVAEPDDSIAGIADKLSMHYAAVKRRIARMERELDLRPAPRGEAAQDHSRRAGAIAKRWRRHVL